MNIEFITTNNWSVEDLEIDTSKDTIITQMHSVNPRGINLYIGYESNEIYDIWTDGAENE